MRKYIFSICILLNSFPVLAQFVQIGSGNYLGTYAGPVRTSPTLKTFNSKYAYIFPKSVLGNLKHGDSIESLEFYRTDGSAFDTSCRLKIWLANTSRSVFGTKKISFSNETSSANLVYQKSPRNDIGTTEDFYKLPFSNKYKYDSTKGDNLVLLVEFNQKDTLKGAFSFYFEGSFSVSGYAAQQTQFSVGATIGDSLNYVTEYHPTIRFNFPRYRNDLFIENVYTLGKIPLPLGNPDSVQVLVRNVGKNAINNFKCYTFSKGKNIQKDSFLISLPKGQEKFFRVPSLSPSKKGQDTVYVVCSDDNLTNDTAYSIRLGNENTYSYRDITQSPAPGGIGFNGSQGDFVARFQSNLSKAINQVSVMFASYGDLFQIGIWSFDSVNCKPGKMLYLSDSLTTVLGTYVLDLKKPVKVKGSFFVGVRQLELTNIGFGYQMEDPVRPKTFFYSESILDTAWYDFSPSAPFKFMIEPRLQADYDVSALSVDLPKDSINRYTTDTIAPIGTIGNIGTYKPKDSIQIVCEIWGPSLKAYKAILYDTISPGIKRKVTFPKKFFPKELGIHKIIIYTVCKTDQIKDNDTALRYFYVGLKRDVMVDQVMEPYQSYNTYEYLKDTIQPMARILNLGYDNTLVFNTRCVILKGSKSLYNKSISLSLPKFQSKILYWPTFTVNDTGTMKLMLITELSNDVYRFNDTQIRYIIGYKKTDFGIDSFVNPLKSQFYDPGTSINFKLSINNSGLLSLFKVPVILRVYDPSNKLVYQDSVLTDIDPYTKLQVSFKKSLKPIQKGKYRMFATCRGKFDIYPLNDSLTSGFTVGFPFDFLPTKIDFPDTISIGATSYTVQGSIKSQGFIKGPSSVPVIAMITLNGKRVYYSIKNYSIDTGNTLNIQLPSNFSPSKVGVHTLWLITNYAGDYNLKNDTFSKNFFVDVGTDVLPLDIVSKPMLGYFYLGDSIQNLSVQVQEQGRDSVKNVSTNIQLFYKFIKVASSMILNDTFKPREIKQIEAPIKYVFIKPGSYDGLIISYHSNDMNHSNDSFWFTFLVYPKYDLAVIDIDSPSVNGNYLTKQGMYPRVKVTNTGKDSASVPSKIFLQISYPSSNLIWYSDILDIPSIKVKDSVWIKSNKHFVFQKDGVLNVYAFLKDNNDYLPLNDTLKSGIVIAINDVALLNSVGVQVYPNPANSVLNVHSLKPIQQIYILDAIGRQIENWTINGSQNQVQLDLKNLKTSTVYYLKLDLISESMTIPIFVVK